MLRYAMLYCTALRCTLNISIRVSIHISITITTAIAITKAMTDIATKTKVYTMLSCILMHHTILCNKYLAYEQIVLRVWELTSGAENRSILYSATRRMRWRRRGRPKIMRESTRQMPKCQPEGASKHMLSTCYRLYIISHQPPPPQLGDFQKGVSQKGFSEKARNPQNFKRGARKDKSHVRKDMVFMYFSHCISRFWPLFRGSEDFLAFKKHIPLGPFWKSPSLSPLNLSRGLGPADLSQKATQKGPPADSVAHPSIFHFSLFILSVFQFSFFESSNNLWSASLSTLDSSRRAVQVGPILSSGRQFEAMVLFLGWDLTFWMSISQHFSRISNISAHLSALWRPEFDSPREAAHKNDVEASIFNYLAKIPPPKWNCAENPGPESLRGPTEGPPHFSPYNHPVTPPLPPLQSPHNRPMTPYDPPIIQMCETCFEIDIPPKNPNPQNETMPHAGVGGGCRGDYRGVRAGVIGGSYREGYRGVIGVYGGFVGGNLGGLSCLARGSFCRLALLFARRRARARRSHAKSDELREAYLGWYYNI